MFLNETNSSQILPKLKQKQTTVNNIGVIYILRSILSRYRSFFEIVVPILTIKDGVSWVVYIAIGTLFLLRV